MSETIRKQMASLLDQETRSARELSGLLGIPEKEVYDHLEHLRLTLQASGQKLHVIPSRCRQCGFSFTARNRLKKPGRCPRCRGTFVSEPLYAIG